MFHALFPRHLYPTWFIVFPFAEPFTGNGEHRIFTFLFFFVDFGETRTHQVRLEGGDASTDTFCYAS